MNSIFKYNANANYSTKDLRGRHNSNSFSQMNVYLDEKGPSVKIQLLNIFKDYHILGKPSPTTVGYHEWPLPIALSTKFYNNHGKCKPELNQYFHMYQYQINFAMFNLHVPKKCLNNAILIVHEKRHEIYKHCVQVWKVKGYIFCSTSAHDISWKHFNLPNLYAVLIDFMSLLMYD